MARSQGRQYTSTRQTTYRENRNERQAYVYGSAVRVPERIPQRQPVERPERRVEENPRPRTKRQAKKKTQFSIPFFMFLMCTIAFCGFVLVQYVSVRSEITANHEKITKLQSTLNDIRLENDEDYSRICNSIDLNEIKMKAIGKLGMTYATEGQIVYYNELDDDYVRQVLDIPTK